MGILLHLKCTVQIDHQLQLQSMIQGHQVKGGISGLIVNDTDIQFAILSRHGIHTVDAAALKYHLEPFWLKLPGFQLLLHCPHRSSHNSLGPLDHIFISGTAFEDGISIICGHSLHTAIHNVISLFLGKRGPLQAFPLHFQCKPFQYLMHHISTVHGFKFVFRTGGEQKAILKEMSKGTGRKAFQPGCPIGRDFSVKSLRHTFTDDICRLFRKRSFHQILDQSPVFGTFQIPAVKLGKQRISL